MSKRKRLNNSTSQGANSSSQYVNNELHEKIKAQELAIQDLETKVNAGKEYAMTHGNNPPPLNFDGNITEDDMERAKKMYENAIKSLELPR